MFVDMRLPKFCATRIDHVHGGRPIIIRRGEKGYWAGEVMDAHNWRNPDEFVTWFNERHGASAAAVAAMEMGSMFGWHTGGARLDYWERQVPAAIDNAVTELTASGQIGARPALRAV